MNFETQLQDKREIANQALSRLIEQQAGIGSDLKKAIKYTLEAPGKRVRSALVLWCCELISGSVNDNAEIAAAAIEMVHTYSLVHDDLPSMDNDDFRRGQPTCHKVFDEATAILVGDSLLTLAFEVLARQIDEPTVAVKLIGLLAEAAGPAGMIKGQLADLKAENSHCTEEFLQNIHIDKTARMFRCAATMGAVAGGADEDQIQRLGDYGLKIGLCFQIADDILDVSSSSEQLGKTAGKDEKAGKATYPSVVGLQKSKQVAEELTNEALTLLEPFSPKADTLRQLATALLKRTR
ncbi:MAG: polyprenyl synthetase family protein [Planctomycetota bacterium]|jgi:geranylgeranyl pyrophosphate synthase